MSDLPDDASDGQFADYMAAMESGENGDWNVGIVEYECSNCNSILQLQSDGVDSNFLSHISEWHEKANDGDYFARFVFEYLSFIAHVKNNLFYDEPRDRPSIQRLKRDARIRSSYLEMVNRSNELRSVWESLFGELNKQPLRNSSHDFDNPEVDAWWNSPGDHPDRESEDPKGVVNGLEDWPNMVEFWYAVRNNLFHGGKNPSIQRDLFLVEHAYLTLSPLMEIELERLKAS